MRLNHRDRMRLESHDHAPDAETAGQQDNLGEDLPMADVDPVESTDGHHRLPSRSRGLRQVSDQFQKGLLLKGFSQS